MTIESFTLGPDLAKALIAAHAELRNPKTDAENSFFNSKYATLAACRDAAAPILAKHGVLLMQDLKTSTLPTADGGAQLAVECWTILLHESGQAVQFGPLVLPAGQPTAQALGSAATFARRYAHNAATNISADEDDDANEATQPAAAVSSRTSPTRAPHPRPPAPASNTPISRPTGLFGYGKKFPETPWNVMKLEDLEWFRDAERVPPAIRAKCRAEIAWREQEIEALDIVRDREREQLEKEAAAGFDDNIPFS